MTTTAREVHWPAYDHCPTCGARPGQPCLDLRDPFQERPATTPGVHGRRLRPGKQFLRPYACDNACTSDRDYQNHRFYGEEPCPASKHAHNALRVRRPRRPQPIPEHGTRNRYERERKAYRAFLAGTGPEAPEPCDACKKANADRVAGRNS